jgi:hypothetical protein
VLSGAGVGVHPENGVPSTKAGVRDTSVSIVLSGAGVGDDHGAGVREKCAGFGAETGVPLLDVDEFETLLNRNGHNCPGTGFTGRFPGFLGFAGIASRLKRYRIYY